MKTEQTKRLINRHPDSSGAVPADLRHKNRISVLNVFRRGGAFEVNEIAAITGISRQTVSKSVQYFINKGLVSDLGKGLSTDIGGKRPHLYRFSCSKMLLSVTAWPDILNLTLMDMNATKIDNEITSNEIKDDPEEYFNEIGSHISEILKRNGISEDNLYGVALSVPGTIDYRRSILKYSSISPAWGTDIPVAAILRPYVGENCIIFPENAGKMTARALLAEDGIASKRVLSLFTTWGFSACLIDKGHILNGKDSLIGEIGHMIIDPSDTERCGCGGYGCLERQISEARLQHMIEERRGRYPASALLGKIEEGVKIRDIFTASANGDEFAKELVSYMAKNAAMAVHNVTLTFDPDIVVFHGNFAKADKWFDTQFKTYLSAFKYYPEQGTFEIRYDDRPLDALDMMGAANSLTGMFFEDPELFCS